MEPAARPMKLANYGNTCYVNAALQCLHHCAPFRAAVAAAGGRSAMWRALADLFASGGREAPRMVAALRTMSADLHEQGDVHEFVYRLLDRLHADVKLCDNEQSPGHCETDAADAAWHAFLKQEGTSVLTSVFHGQSETRVACGACGWRTSSYDPFCCITLGRVGRTIAESLAHWCESEAVPDWRCDGCSIRGRGTRRVALARAPAVLMLLLPAFVFEQPAPVAITLDEVLRFSGRTYRLASVACHVGSRRERGHYHAICRADDGGWWQLDDDAPPQPVSSAAAPRGRPYLAFYVSDAPS